MGGKRSGFSHLIIQGGIVEKQIEQLISFTKSDKLIQSQTHDLVRFKNKNTYSNWAKKKRVIYTLLDDQKNLLGIIWFGKQSLHNIPDYPHTFAIRVYEAIRGKGFALPFMQKVFKDFYKSNEGGVWLKTQADNVIAIKIYNKFGFKEISKNKNGEIIMTYSSRVI